MDGEVCTPVIRRTEVNAGEFAAMVKLWPELHNPVRCLQAGGLLLPSPRTMQIEPRGRESVGGQGVGEAAAENAPQGR